MKRILVLGLALTFSFGVQAQIEEDDLGAWYMYFFNTKIKESDIGFQGDIQYRNWNTIGDLEQLLLRGGVYYQPKNTNIKLVLGYANITTGVMGDSDETSMESRIYQEFLIPQKITDRLYLTHRYRYEQRFVEDQDFRTRYRYALFLNLPLNAKKFVKNTVYLAMYNELFINGERNIGDNRRVEVFDRNRTYLGIGYGVMDNLRVQAGWMRQLTDNWGKNQLQFSVHHKIRK